MPLNIKQITAKEAEAFWESRMVFYCRKGHTDWFKDDSSAEASFNPTNSQFVDWEWGVEVCDEN